MAHNQQQDLWQLGAENLGNAYGWAGRMMEMLGASGSLSPLISVNQGQNYFVIKKPSKRLSTVREAVYMPVGMTKSVLMVIFPILPNVSIAIFICVTMQVQCHVISLENEALKKILAKHPNHYSYPKSDLAEHNQIW